MVAVGCEPGAFRGAMTAEGALLAWHRVVTARKSRHYRLSLDASGERQFAANPDFGAWLAVERVLAALGAGDDARHPLRSILMHVCDGYDPESYGWPEFAPGAGGAGGRRWLLGCPPHQRARREVDRVLALLTGELASSPSLPVIEGLE